jgi:hypothetical protein
VVDQALVDPSKYYFSKSSAIAVIAVTPVVIAGAYTGANSAECSPGSGTPVLWLSSSFPDRKRPANTSPLESCHRA